MATKLQYGILVLKHRKYIIFPYCKFIESLKTDQITSFKRKKQYLNIFLERNTSKNKKHINEFRPVSQSVIYKISKMKILENY